MNDPISWQPYASPPPARRDDRLGTFLFGGIVVMLGVLWLLDSAGVIGSPWGAALPLALVAVGVALVVGSRSGLHSGLIGAGIALTAILTASSIFSLPTSGAIGDREARPTAVTDLKERYDLLMGEQTLDLRDLPWDSLGPGDTEVEARVGIGELLVLVPSDVTLVIEWRVGVGDADVLEVSRSGFGLSDDYAVEGATGAQRRLVLDLSVGIGSLGVRHEP